MMDQSILLGPSPSLFFCSTQRRTPPSLLIQSPTAARLRRRFRSTPRASVVESEFRLTMEKVYVGRASSMTRIVWTLGPACRSVEMIEKLLKSGMNVARFNFSYGSHAYHQETLDNLRTAVHNSGILCAVMLDTKGPEIRTGSLIHGKPIELKEGQEISISCDYTIQGDSNMISLSYKKLAEHVNPGSVILCSDSMLSLTVLSCDKSLGLVCCRCDNSGLLGEREKVHLPGTDIDLPTLTEEDKQDILQWGVPNNINIIALSFVRKGSDLDKVRKLLGENQKNIMLMAKFDNEEAVANLDEIMEKADAVMVARGDLRMELLPPWIFTAQKRILAKANAEGKPVVTAVQLFDSDSISPRPTSAESIDVVNAVLQGTDCVMLSGVSVSPETVVQTLSSLCRETEESIDYRSWHRRILGAVGRSISKVERTCVSAVTRIGPRMKPKVIVVVDKSVFKAEVVAKYRPAVPILSVVDGVCPDVASRGLVYRGIIPVLEPRAWKSMEELLTFGVEAARDEGFRKVGDLVLVAHEALNGDDEQFSCFFLLF